MKSKISLLFVLIVFFNCKETEKPTQTKSVDPIEYSMDNNAQLFLEIPEINSISIGVYKDGKTYTGYYGEVDPGKNTAPNDNSIYELASVTKSFTGILAAQAVLDKKITVDDDIRTYLDGTYPNLEYNNRPILIRDLLTHSSEITRELSQPLTKLFSSDATKEDKEAIKNYDRKALFKDLQNFELDTIPGTRYQYSPVLGPEIMALILERVYNKSYSELLDIYILSKANMTNTQMTLDASKNQKLMNGYNDEGERVDPVFIPMTAAGAGLKTTIPDMIKYMTYLLESDNAVIKEMQKPLFFDTEDEDQYGYFWMLTEGFRHRGGTKGNTNWLIINPEINAGFTVMFNTNGNKTGNLLNGIASRILDDLENYPLKNFYFPVKNEIFKNIDSGIEFYKQLKNESIEEYDFDNSRTLNRIGYDLLNKKRNLDAIKVFKLLVSEFPEEGNPYDSLGEAYFINEQYDLSLENYKKSFELNPNNGNAKKMIDELNKLMSKK